MGKKLSIIIPCYNEEEYVEKVLKRVTEVSLDYNLAKEIIIVNDGSTDFTQEKINAFINDHPAMFIKSIQHQENYGKGACIK
ncbi:MAG TPA: glycosyltransferase, partial [Chitinophagaceae bacterium]